MANDAASSRVRVNPTLGCEFLVSGEDGDAVDAERRGKRACAREDVAGSQPAMSDIVGDRARYLEIHRLPAGTIEIQNERPPRTMHESDGRTG